MAACGHPLPRKGVGYTVRLWLRSFPFGPSRARGTAAEPELYPSFGGLAVPLGGVAPHLPLHKGKQCGRVCLVSGVSETRPAGLGLTCALEAGVGRDLCSDVCGPWINVNKVFLFGVLPYADPSPLWLMFVHRCQAKALTQPRLEPSLSTDGRLTKKISPCCPCCCSSRIQG